MRSCCALLAAVLLLVAGCGPRGDTRQAKRNYVTQMKNETLVRLYREKPEVRSRIKKAPGFAVFSSINTNLFLFSSASGYGVAVDNATGNQVYMKMYQLGVGPGIGIKDYRAVFVFRTREAFQRFITEGLEFGGHADAAAKSGKKGEALGGEVGIRSDIDIYTLTETGVALQATIAGTKYWRDDELN